MTKHIHGGDVYKYDHCLDFSANCNPLGTPQSVKQAIIDSVEDLSDYPRVGCGPLKEAIADYEHTKKEYLICGNGAADLIFSLSRALNPKKALLPAPTFAEYEQALVSVGCEISRYYLKEENDFCIQGDYPDILKKWQDKFRYILVDEFQDVNQAQYDVVRMLAEPQNNLFVVGDDDQSVYGFRGAKPGIMMEFMKDYPKARRVLLDINYRSSAYIVNGALRVIGNNKIRFEKKIEAFQKADETVHVQEVKDPVQEAEYVLEKIKDYQEKGIAYTDIAVLYRTNVDARTMSELMMEYQIPFVMKEHLNNIYEHFIAQDISSYFHLSQGEYSRKYFLQIANRPNRFFSRDSMKGGTVTYDSLREYYRDKNWMTDRVDQLEWDMKMMKDKTPYAAIQYIRKHMGYDEFLKDYAVYRKISPEDLFAVLEEIWQNSKGYRTIRDWFEHVERYGKILKEQNCKKNAAEGVNLMTMHAAKGLEFDTVFVIGADEGSSPYKKAVTDEEIEEERRLFYVAMTRAKRKLIISYVKEKNGKDMIPSRFVSELLFDV